MLFADHSSSQINSYRFFCMGNPLERNSLAWKTESKFGILASVWTGVMISASFFSLSTWQISQTMEQTIQFRQFSWGPTPSDRFECSQAILWKLDFTVSPHSKESRWLDKVRKVMNVIPKYFDGMLAFVHCYYCWDEAHLSTSKFGLKRGKVFIRSFSLNQPTSQPPLHLFRSVFVSVCVCASSCLWATLKISSWLLFWDQVIPLK